MRAVARVHTHTDQVTTRKRKLRRELQCAVRVHHCIHTRSLLLSLRLLYFVFHAKPIKWVTYSVGYSVMHAVESRRIRVADPGHLCQAIASQTLLLNLEVCLGGGEDKIAPGGICVDLRLKKGSGGRDPDLAPGVERAAT